MASVDLKIERGVDLKMGCGVGVGEPKKGVGDPAKNGMAEDPKKGLGEEPKKVFGDEAKIG